MNIADRTINALQTDTTVFQQSENSALKYTVNYAAVLQSDTISSSTFSSANTLSITSPTNTAATASAIISGTPGHYNLINKIVTASGQTEERRIKLHITRNEDIPVPGDYESW